ncbi:MAG: hypothetical protein SFW07_03740, partial [Gammaproteobacteria bacterium]|nr:hypothetical protein [Gammaproteobacteria bacterium]
MEESSLGEVNPQTPEEKIELFKRMCEELREGTDEFFALYQEFIKNLHSYPDELSQRFAKAIDSINNNLFFAFLTAEHSDKLSLYLYFASRKDKKEQNNSRALQLLNRIINNFQSSNFTHQQCLQLMQAVINYNPDRREDLQRLISPESLIEAEGVAENERKRKIQRLEKYYRLNLSGKSYFSAERRAVRRLIFALGKGRFQGYRQRLLNEASNGSDVETAKLINQILPHLPVKSNDGKRTYWLNLEETEAVVIIPELGMPHPDKKFRVKKLPQDIAERRKIASDSESINEYFHHDIAGDFVISDYVPGKNWSEYDGRVAPKGLTVAQHITSLCEKLRNVAERKPPIDSEGRSYFWTRRELHQMDDSRENINLLVPVIRHYLGVSDPLCNTNFDAIMRLAGAVGIDDEFRKIIGGFLARMLGSIDKRPDIKEVVEFFECAKRYQENKEEEELEVLNFIGHKRDVFIGNYGLPQFPKARWLWFVELSNQKFYEYERLKWRKLAEKIAAEKEKYTPQQRQFLRKKLQEYREQQFDRDEYKKIIDAAGSLFDETP